MQRRAFLVVMLVMICHYAATITRSQQLVAEFPLPNAVSVDPDAAILIRAPGPIAPHSVSIHYPNADMRGFTFQEPTIRIVETAMRNTPQALRNGREPYGKIELAAPNLLRFTHGRLRPLTRYTCIAQGIQINGGLELTRLEFDFTTRADIPRFTTCTLDSMQQIPCTKSIELIASSDLLTCVIDPMQIIKLETNSETDATSWSPQPCGVSVHDGGRRVSITPLTQWRPGVALRVSVKQSLLTGDTHDDRSYTTIVRNAGQVLVDVEASDGRTVPSFVTDQLKSAEQVAIAGSEFTLAAPALLGDHWRFVKWTHPRMTLPTTSSVHVTIPCDVLLARNHFTAIVERIDSQRLEITIDSGGVVDVFDSDMHLFKTVEHSEIITLNDAIRKVVVVARPLNGFKLKKWISPWKPIDGGTSAAIVIPTDLSFDVAQSGGQSVYTRTIKPEFEQWMSPQNVYRLRADVVDVDSDPRYDPYIGVTFTTQREYEEYTQTRRMVCVQAQRCWQIVGYSIANENKIDFFGPEDHYCVTADLTNPENRITFFVQRAPTYLRVEKVLISSDNTDDVIAGKRTHSETYVRVERRESVNGILTWRTMSAVSCSFNGIPYSEYDLKCGDEVRFRIRSSPIRGEMWSSFADIDLYALPTQAASVGGDIVYEMVVDNDVALFPATDCTQQPLDEPEVRVRACFRQQFGIDQISMKVRVVEDDDRAKYTFVERWYDPLLYRDAGDDEPPGGHHLEYIPNKGTRIRVKYTLPIDARTVFAGGMSASSYGNVLVNSPHVQGLDFSVPSFDGEHIHFEARDGNDYNTVVFDVFDPRTTPRLQALHCGIIDVTCGTSLTSLSGLPLQYSALFVIDRVQNPGFALSLESVEWKYDGDADVWPFVNSGDMYFAFYGGDMAVDKALHINAGFQRYPVCQEQQGTVPDDCTFDHSDKDGAYNFSHHQLWIQPHWMDQRDFAWFRGASYDEECKDENDCWVNRIGEMIYKVRDRADGHADPDDDTPIDWEKIIPELIAVGAEFLATLLVADDQDQFLGAVNFLEPGGTLWGMNTGTAPLIQLNDGNVKFTISGRFYVDKAIIR